ncbi:PHP domain-containing protein [Candidatus Woesearchaeota archaeon]|nr:PHP domain-containing protein [Candidatus Woesearchaeota archaeon]
MAEMMKNSIKNSIIFEKPSHDLLKAVGMQGVDMHFHTRYSDTNVHIRSIIKRAKEKGIGVAITDHNEIAGSLEAARNIEGVLIIPGIEVSCLDGPHILLYFYSFKELVHFFETHIKPNRGKNPFLATNIRTAELIHSTRKYNCLRVAAHPYGYMIANNGLSKAIGKAHVSHEVMRDIDGLEVICGAIGRRYNRKAVEQARLLGRAVTGGTDGHTLFQLGEVLTISRADTRKEFLDNIKKKNNIVMGKELKMVPKIVPATKMLKTHAIDYTVPTIKLQSRLLYDRAVGRADKIKCNVKERIKKNRVAKKINGIFKKNSF